MKVSELISMLEGIKKTDGDIPVFAYDEDELLNTPLVSVDRYFYSENDYDIVPPDDEEDQPKCVIIKGEWV